jgi:serine/threonine protein kinase
MNREDYQQVKQIFQSVLDIAPDHRAEYLNEKCADNPAIRCEVEKLLNSYQSGYLEQPAIEKVAQSIIGSNLLIGQEIGHYKIVKKIGAGGMGEVYLAEDTTLDRRVAIKILPPEFSEDAQRMSRFVREAKSASALNHPNIITIHEIGEIDQIHFIATEYIEGETLHRRLKGQPLGLKSVLEIVIQIISALDAAHQAGIIHRDIKPENVMIRPDGLVKILDFGIAKLSESPKVGLNVDEESTTAVNSGTIPGMIIGTANYMSPEQARGQKIDTRTDIFSFGIVLYEMLSGQKAFESAHAMDVIGAILHKEPPPLNQLLPELPHEIDRIVKKTLRKDRDERYQTAKGLLADLKDARQELDFQNKLEQTLPLKSDDAKTRSQRAALTVATNNKFNLLKWFSAPIAILLVFGLGYLAWDSWKTKNPFEKFGLKALTSSGIIVDSSISPDGKMLALVRTEKGNQSLWIQQKEINTSEIRLTEPTSESNILGIRFIPTGNRIYFLQRPKNNSVSQLFSVPILGGQPPQFILDDVDSPPAFSPDGSKFAFMRRNTKEGITALIVADSDGSNLQEIVQRKMPLSFMLRPLGWSPDGQRIALAANDEADVGAHRIAEIDLRDKQLKVISRQSWLEIESLAWLNDGSGLIFSAVENKRRLAHSLWTLNYSDGAANLLTKDLNDYAKISVALKTGEILVQQTKLENGVWIIDQNPSNPPRRITQNNADGGQGISWVDESNLVSTSEMNSLNRLQKISIDGGNPIVLTSAEEFFRNPCVTAEGKYVVFAFTKENITGIWRMDANGGNLTLLTKIGGEFPHCSKDGWVYFNALIDGKSLVWKISVEGGEPQKVTDKTAVRAKVSPDASKAAFYYREDAKVKWEIAVISTTTNEILQKLELPAAVQLSTPFDWSADGKALIFIEAKEGLHNLLEINLVTGKQRQITNFTDDNLPQIVTFAVSPSGKSIAVTRGRKITDIVQVVGN